MSGLLEGIEGSCFEERHTLPNVSQDSTATDFVQTFSNVFPLGRPIKVL
jgi:hypothetical protein